MSRKPFVKRARFIVNPLHLMASMLPPGNELHSLTISETGMLEFEIVGIDVPKEAAERIPLLLLKEHTDAKGFRERWFEPGVEQLLTSMSASRHRRDAEPA
jgi:hypothetical protein